MKCADEGTSRPPDRPIREMQEISLRETIPLFVHLELTYLCNERCVHCYRVERDEPELDTGEVKSLLGGLAELGSLFLMVTGGEPMMRPDFFEIMEAARSMGFALRLLTNGTLVDAAAADRIRELRFQEVGISLYGGRAETHDAVTGLPGSFERTLGALKLLTGRGVRVHVKCPLMTLNFMEAREVHALADGLGVWCLMDVSLTPRDDGGREPLAYRLNGEALRGVVADPLLFGGTHAPQVEGKPGKGVCDAGRNLMGVSPYGDVWPCLQMKSPAGNVRVRPVGEIWREGKVFRDVRGVREEDMAECLHCADRPHCARCAGVALLEDGNALGPSRRACEVAGILGRIREEKARGE